MSYHNDPYRVDYLKIYPCLKERPDVLEVLKKSDRKMKYMEVDLKSEQRRKNAENGAESYVPSKEDSLERLVYSAKCQFADDAEGVEDAVIRKDDLCRLRAALDQLSEEERFLIHALFFDERSERELDAEAIARIVDAEIKKLVETARENCHKLLQENINLLHALAKALLDRETITGDDIDLLVKGEPLPPFDADGSAAKQEPAAPAPASADAGGETFKLEAEPSQDGGTGEKTQDETKQQ